MANRRRTVLSVVSGANPNYILALTRQLLDCQEKHETRELVPVVNQPNQELRDTLLSLGAGSTRMNPVAQGFASNHNSTLRSHPTASFFVIANDDVSLPDAGVVDRLVAFLEEPGNERIGVVSPRLLNRDGSLQPSTYSFPTAFRTSAGYLGLRAAIGEDSRAGRLIARMMGAGAGKSRLWAHDRSLDVDTLRGAFVVVRGATVRDVGLMDEVALVGFEEVEWHYRMRKRGWRVHFLSHEAIIHYGSATVGGRADLELEYLKGCINFFAKHRTPTGLLAVRIAALLSFFFRSLRAGSKDTRVILRKGATISLTWKPDRAHQNLRLP